MSLIRPLKLYRSYRAYLKDMVEHEHSRTPPVTRSALAKKFGMSSTHFCLILQGKRDLSVAGIHRIARALRMSSEDWNEFETLVLFEQAQDSVSKRYYRVRLDSLRKERKTVTRLYPQFFHISQWYLPILLVYLCDFEVEDGLAGLSKAIGIPITDLQKAEAELRKQGIIEEIRGESDQQVCEVRIDPIQAKLRQQKFIRHSVEEALRRMSEAFDDPEMLFSTYTFSIPRRHIPSLIERFKSLISEAMNTSRANEEDLAILQWNTQLLTLVASS